MTTKIESNPFWGMGVYEFHIGGTLTGEWNNNSPTDTITLHHEIARKKSSPKEFTGDYHVCWIEHRGVPIRGTLVILEHVDQTSTWKWFTEDDNQTPIFVGRGIRISENKYTVLYWSGDNLTLTL